MLNIFYNCPNLKEVIYAEGCTTTVRTYLKAATSVTIPNTVTSIANNTFYDFKELTSIEIPNSVTTIGESAFSGCTGLTLLTIGNSVTTIGSSAFENCSGLTSINIPNSVITIDHHAFKNCTNVTSCILGNSVTTLGEYSLENMGFTTITIPNSVTSIGSGVFYSCQNLEELIIRVNNKLEIGNAIFRYCDKVNSIKLYGATLPKNADYDFMGNDKYSSTVLYVPYELYNDYRATSPWSRFYNIERLPDVVYLTDGNTYYNDAELKNFGVEYTRTFNNTAWQALYVPFSMSYDDWKDDFEIAYINSIRQYDNNSDGAIDVTIMDVIKIENGSLLPNTPYLIKAKSTGEKTIALNATTVYPTEENSVDCSTTIAKFTFIGTYNTIPAATMLENEYYAMGGGSLIMTDGESSLKPFRWYMKIDARSPMYTLDSAAKAITIRVVGEEEEATGINELQFTNDKLPVYDLNGRMVNDSTLKPGLYIKNGKKVVIK